GEGVAEFRHDLGAFGGREAVEAVVVPGRHELPPITGVRYVAFADPAGGSGRDSMTLAIAHIERRGERRGGVLGLIREREPPFSPGAIVQGVATTVVAHWAAPITRDRYAGSWPAEQLSHPGVTVVASHP